MLLRLRHARKITMRSADRCAQESASAERAWNQVVQSDEWNQVEQTQEAASKVEAKNVNG
jgi:hypothetical protein